MATGIPQIIDQVTQFFGGTDAAWNNLDVPVPDKLVVIASDPPYIVKKGDGVSLYRDLPVLFHAEELLDLGVQLAGKAPLNHTHAIADIVNLAATLAAKAEVGHTHSMSDINGLAAALTALTIPVEQVIGVARLLAGTSAAPPLNLSLESTAEALVTCLYNTATDSDGGLWRLKHVSTSLALEPPQAGLRSGVAAWSDLTALSTRYIANTLVAYDLRDLDANDRPVIHKVWPVVGATSLWAGEGRILIGTATGLLMLDLRGDRVYRWTTDGRQVANQTLAAFNHGTALWSTERGAAAALPGNTVREVFAVVEPSALLDGLGYPIPTLFVATNGGSCVIRPDGAATRLTNGNDTAFKPLGGGRVATAVVGAGEVRVGPFPYAEVAATTWRDPYYNRSNTAAVPFPVIITGDLGLVSIPDGFAVGDRNSAGGVVMIAEAPLPTQGLMAQITSYYNTGWLPGGTVVATACDVRSGNLVDAGERLTNPDFQTDLTGWTAADLGAGTSSWNNGNLRITGSDNNNRGVRTQSFTSEAGEVYVIEGVVSGADYTPKLLVGTSAGGGDLLTIMLPGGAFRLQFGATGTTVHVALTKEGSGVVEWDRVSIRPALPDRAASGVGGTVQGTIQRVPVATGAQLCAVRGFDTNNYVTYPYAAAHDATGDVFFKTWFKCDQNGAVEMFWSRGAFANGAWAGIGLQLFLDALGRPTLRATNAGSVTDSLSADYNLADTQWHCVIGQRRANAWELIIDGVLAKSLTATVTGSLANAGATLWYGASQDNAARARYSTLVLSAYGKGSVGIKQAQRMYREERALLAQRSKATLVAGGQPVVALVRDPVRGQLVTGSNDGFTLIDGVTPLAWITPTSHPGVLLNKTIRGAQALSVVDGQMLLGTTQNLAVVSLDRANHAKPLPRRTPNRQIVTVNSTPTTFGHRYIGEGEMHRVTARVIGLEGEPGTSRVGIDVTAIITRNDRGNGTLLRNQAVEVWDRTNPNATASVVVLDNALYAVQVTGISGVRMQWTVEWV